MACCSACHPSLAPTARIPLPTSGRLGDYAAKTEPLALARAKAAAQLVFNVGTLLVLTLVGGIDVAGWAAAVAPLVGLAVLLAPGRRLSSL